MASSRTIDLLVTHHEVGSSQMSETRGTNLASVRSLRSITARFDI
jgi:hypothetical protein